MNRNYLLLLPIFAIIAFYGCQHRDNLAGEKNKHKIPIVDSIKRAETKSKAKVLSSPPILNESDEAIKKSTEAGREWKAMLTPELKEALVDGRFLKFKIEYDAFFKQWNVDSALAAEVIAIAKDRDYRLRENSLANLNGGVRNYKEFTRQEAAIREVADIELLVLLGADCSRALAELEKDMLERHRASVRRR